MSYMIMPKKEIVAFNYNYISQRHVKKGTINNAISIATASKFATLTSLAMSIAPFHS